MIQFHSLLLILVVCFAACNLVQLQAPVHAFQPISNRSFASLQRVLIHSQNCEAKLYFTTSTLHQSNDSNDDNDDTKSVSMVTSLPKNEKDWKEFGEKLIINTALNTGGSKNSLKEEDIDIQWKPGKIIVTIKNAILKGGQDEDDDENDDMEYDDDFVLEDVEDNYDEEEDDDEDDFNYDDNTQADVVTIARAINYAFGEEGEGSLAYAIAANHEIEVTTPGASDELEGIMFESYKGFNVIVETIDPKNKDGKIKTVEGNLVERNKDFTVLNCKGRRRNLKNQNVLSVKLPKAKREKGVK